MTHNQRIEAAQTALRNDEGDGWMSKAARDMIRIAGFAGFDVAELKRRVAMSTDPHRTTNSASIERVMGEMSAECEAMASGSLCEWCGSTNDVQDTGDEGVLCRACRGRCAS